MSNESDLSNNNSIEIEETSFFLEIITKNGLNHIEIDNDGFYNGLIMPKSHANYLYYTCHMSLFSGLYGLYQNNILALYPLSVYFASINYWKHPLNDWRRYLDIMYNSTINKRIWKSKFYILHYYYDFRFIMLSH